MDNPSRGWGGGRAFRQAGVSASADDGCRVHGKVLVSTYSSWRGISRHRLGVLGGVFFFLLVWGVEL